MNAVGRPTSYDSGVMLPKIEPLMREGASLVELVVELGISRETLNQWMDPDGKYFKPEFSDTVKSGIALSAAWWERKGRKNLENKEFSYVGWYMNMKNRFGWKDRIESEVDNKSSDGSMTPKGSVDKSQVDEMMDLLKKKTADEA